MGKTILIALVVAIVVGGAAAFGGYKMGDSAGFERANLVRQQFAQTRQGGQGQFGQGSASANGQGNSRAGRAFDLQGTVKSVDGDTLTVTVGQRDVTVKLSNTTQIEKAASSSRTDLTAGARVIVTPDSSGASGNTGNGNTTGNSFNATSILILPPL
jgi:hypothetical protein